ncbi:MAG: PIN domain-containing protein [Candidatus Aminicenantes bacterium]|nr:PIN domain-containing protein [Candidatus Aminicenantes bacterium]
MVPEEVVADANVLLSAVIGKAANKIFSEFVLRVHVAEFNAREVEEYLPMMAEKYKLPMDLVQLQWRILPIIKHAPTAAGAPGFARGSTSAVLARGYKPRASGEPKARPLTRYARYYKKAVKDLKERDPEDAHALALARALKLPLWSNDRHLDKMDLPVFSTAKLLSILAETRQ